MTDEELAINDLVSLVSDEAPIEVAPTEEVAEVQEVAPEEVIQEVAPEPVVEEQPRIDPLVALQEQNNANMAQMAEAIKSMSEAVAQSKQAPEPQVELSEEEIAINELRQRLGLDQIMQENEMLKQQIQQQQAQLEQTTQTATQMQKQAQTQAEIARFKAEYPDASEEAIINYIDAMPVPNEVKAQYDTPQGWRWIANQLKAQAQPQAVPDKIIPSQSTPSVPQDSAFDKIKQGKQVSDIDAGEALLKMAGF